MVEDVESGAQQRSRAELARLIREEIHAEHPPGSTLPSYRDFAQKWGAAPNTIGEAMRLLAAEGLVKIKPGAGVEVLAPDARPRDAQQRLRDARAGLGEVLDHLRTVRREVDALESRVADLMTDLRAD